MGETKADKIQAKAEALGAAAAEALAGEKPRAIPYGKIPLHAPAGAEGIKLGRKRLSVVARGKFGLIKPLAEVIKMREEVDEISKTLPTGIDYVAYQNYIQIENDYLDLVTFIDLQKISARALYMEALSIAMGEAMKAYDSSVCATAKLNGTLPVAPESYARLLKYSETSKLVYKNTSKSGIAGEVLQASLICFVQEAHAAILLASIYSLVFMGSEKEISVPDNFRAELGIIVRDFNALIVDGSETFKGLMPIVSDNDLAIDPARAVRVANKLYERNLLRPNNQLVFYSYLQELLGLTKYGAPISEA